MIATEAVGDRTQTVTAAPAATPDAAVNQTVAASTGTLTAKAIYARSRDSVAYITATTSGSGATAAEPGAYGDGSRAPGGGQGGSSSEGAATGSGFVVSSDGDVVTNAHVVDGADAVRVKIGDGDTRKAEVVGVDRSIDIALLKVSAPRALTRCASRRPRASRSATPPSRSATRTASRGR